MYSEQLEKLIEIALANRELTEKEKQVLFRRAEKEGIDLDEFEIVLDNRLNDKNQITQQPEASAVSSNFNRQGNISKCPACGSLTQSFSTNCIDCDFEFSNIQVSDSVIRFFEKIDEIESQRTNIYEEKAELTFGKVLLWIIFYYIFIPYYLIKYLINKTKPVQWSAQDSRKEELIMNYPISNTREDILEFSTLSISKIKKVSLINRFSEEGKYIAKWNSIWIDKTSHILMKAELSMNNDKETLDSLTKRIRSVTENNRKEERIVNYLVWGVIVISIVTSIIILKS